MSIIAFRYMQESLRRAWRKPTPENLKSLWLPRGAEELNIFYIPAILVHDRLELRPADAWSYIKLLFMRDSGDKLTRICANKNCKLLYFIAKRKNQNSAAMSVEMPRISATFRSGDATNCVRSQQAENTSCCRAKSAK